MRKNQGMTLVGMLLTMVVVVMAGIVLMRIVPVYLQHYSVTSSIDALKRVPATELSADPFVNARMLKEKLMKQLYINSIEIPRDKINVVPNARGNFQVSVKYQVTKPLIYNISLLFDFDESHEVNAGAG